MAATAQNARMSADRIHMDPGQVHLRCARLVRPRTSTVERVRLPTCSFLAWTSRISGQAMIPATIADYLALMIRISVNNLPDFNA